jgi:hypothetical protein
VDEKGQDAQFEDPDFPAGRESLIVDWNDKSHETTSIKDKWSNIKWLRPDHISDFKMPIDFPEEDIKPSDIVQG